MTRSVFLAFLGVVMLLATAPALGGHLVAARIIATKGAGPLSGINHNGQVRPITYDARLENGDEVFANDPRAIVVIHYLDGSGDVVLNSGDKPHRVYSASPVATAGSNFISAAIEDLVRHKWSHPRSTLTRTPVTSSEMKLSLDIPGLDDGRAVIAEGMRHAVLQWNGGLAPFTLTITDAAERVLTKQTEVYAGGESVSHRLILEQTVLTFSPGAYMLRITDARGDAVTGRFTAVRVGIPPARDEESASSDLVGASLAAGTELAATRDPRYGLEALFRLHVALDNKWEAAGVVADAIAVLW
ncbi:MAG: hypothetical protein P4L57_01135 [Rhizomicrobium sp.]|nr:hypothetical protein [Rhizomicrobium sp.]